MQKKIHDMYTTQKARADGLFEVKLTVGYTEQGKKQRKSFYSPISKEDARRKGERFLLEQRMEQQRKKGPSVCFREWSERWLVLYKKPQIYQNTYVITYLNIVRNHLQPFFGEKTLEQIRPAEVQQFFAQKTEFSESMRKKMKMCLTGIFETAMENELCTRNPAKRISCAGGKPPRKRPTYTEEQAERVERLAIGRMPEVALLLQTGLRKGEMLGLKWEDVDFAERTITVRRSLADEVGAGVVERPPKWGSTRVVPVADTLLALLRGLPRRGPYLFPRADGSAQSPNSWAHKLSRFMETLPGDLPRLTAHELRHTYGTLLRRRGADIYSIQKVMGHRDIRMTAEIYVHNELDVLRRGLCL